VQDVKAESGARGRRGSRGSGGVALRRLDRADIEITTAMMQTLRPGGCKLFFVWHGRWQGWEGGVGPRCQGVMTAAAASCQASHGTDADPRTFGHVMVACILPLTSNLT